MKKDLLIDKIITDIKANVGWLVNSQPTMLNEDALSTIRSILEVNLDEDFSPPTKKGGK